MFEELIETFLEAKRRWKEVLLSMLYDFLFFFTYGAFSFLILQKIEQHTIAALGIAQKNQGALNGANSLMEVLGQISGLGSEFYAAMFFAFILFVFVYVAYVLWQWLSWRTLSREKSAGFAKKFALYNLFWLVFYFVAVFFEGTRNFIARIEDQNNPSTLLFTVIYFVLFFLACVSYSLITKRKGLLSTFRYVFRLKSLFVLLEIGALFFIVDSLIIILAQIDEWLAIGIGAPLALALLSFSKLHILKTIQQTK